MIMMEDAMKLKDEPQRVLTVEANAFRADTILGVFLSAVHMPT
jgi:hypothetical protein